MYKNRYMCIFFLSWNFEIIPELIFYIKRKTTKFSVSEAIYSNLLVCQDWKICLGNDSKLEWIAFDIDSTEVFEFWSCLTIFQLYNLNTLILKKKCLLNGVIRKTIKTENASARDSKERTI